MIKKLKKTDIIFAIALLSGLLLHAVFLFIVPFFHDETYYATVPFRLIFNGDSLIQHEWHLTQFFTVFSYLPMYIWTAIKNSADGVFIFLRCTYILIHTTLAVIIYRFFRKYGNWAIMASMIFYVQITYRIQAISYQSMLVVFLLLLSLCLVSIYQKQSVQFYIFAGICFGGCCVCNPLFCIAFALYLLVCVLWTKRQNLINYVVKVKTSHASEKGKKLTKKQKREQKSQALQVFPNVENYNCFFNKEAILWISCGILIMAIIAVSFFFLTGGTIESIFNNVENLLGNSEYDITSDSAIAKPLKTLGYFSKANLGMPWILPIIFIVMFFDKNKKTNAHRFVYLAGSLVWAMIFMFATLIGTDFNLFGISFPFFVISTVCYILTENKNKVLFNCMYIPCLIAACIHYLAVDTHLAGIGVVIAIGNVVGVFFAMDLWKEVQSASKENEAETTAKKRLGACHKIIIVAFSLQILFYGIFYMYGQVPMENPTKATTGPYSGLYMSREQYNQYDKAIDDMDVIKNLTDEDDPVLLASYNNWMYLYLERPMATYSTWYRGSINPDMLIEYYKENPEKIPKYVYIETTNPDNPMVQTVGEIFSFSKENLSNGILLTVKNCKF